MSDYVWKDATMTIDGVRFGGIDSISYEREPDFGCDLSSFALERRPAGSYTAEVSVPCTVESFAGLFGRIVPPGASAETLARRVRYGGRKGRRAMRRLFDRAIPIEYRTGGLVPLSFRGKAVFLPNGEIRCRLSGGGAER